MYYDNDYVKSEKTYMKNAGCRMPRVFASLDTTKRTLWQCPCG